MVNDTIADLIIRIKNSYLARQKSLTAPYSKIGAGILKILKEEGFIKDFKTVKEKFLHSKNTYSVFEIDLLYKNRLPAMTNIRRISKPGVRIYTEARKIPYVLSGYGIAIISTPKGIISGKEAKKKALGGEIICSVW